MLNYPDIPPAEPYPWWAPLLERYSRVVIDPDAILAERLRLQLDCRREGTAARSD